LFSDEERRTKPTAALKRLVYSRDKGICRLCNQPVDQFDFDIGHNKAFAKGGKLTLQNAILLHPKCNRSMQKLSLREARAALGMQASQDELAKRILSTLSMTQLKLLAKENFVQLRSRVERGGWFSEDTVVRPSKRQYINALARMLSADQIKSRIASMPKPERKRRHVKKKSFWSF
jgi:hypothetical protein